MSGASIFVVDDEVQICTLLTRILQRQGYAVRAFSTPQEALDAVESGRPDLVLTDLMMPGMTGIELVRRMRVKAPRIGAVLTTGYASVDTVVDALRSGIDDFVTKPFSVAEIRGVVSRVLQRPGLGAPVEARNSTTADAPDENAALVRRCRDSSYVESVHGLLAESLSAADLLPRCGAVLGAALDAGRAALLSRERDSSAFRVRSATTRAGPFTSRHDVDSDALKSIVSWGSAACIEASALGAAASLLDVGPLAAAPLSSSSLDGRTEDAGVLIVSRAAPARRFEPEDLRVLGIVAAAVGDVFRAIRAAETAEDAYFRSLRDVVVATESRTPWFARHGERVRDFSVALARRIGLPESDVETVEMAAPILDLGRVETPDDLLGKAASPTDEEWRSLRGHAARADEMVRPLGRLWRVKPVIRHHHENWDGTGYPDGLAGDDIPHLASIVRIADAFAALTSNRAWRPALSADSAARRISEMSGTHFHPRFAAEFVAMQAEGRSPAPASP